MGQLTTHILDTANGCPASGVTIKLFSVDDDGKLTAINSVVTTSDGRCDSAVLTGCFRQRGLRAAVSCRGLFQGWFSFRRPGVFGYRTRPFWHFGGGRALSRAAADFAVRLNLSWELTPHA